MSDNIVGRPTYLQGKNLLTATEQPKGLWLESARVECPHCHQELILQMVVQNVHIKLGIATAKRELKIGR